MKKLNIFLFLVFLSFFSFSQAPRIQWQRCLGGSGDEEIGRPVFPFPFSSPNNALTVISNNKYILGGQTNSIDGDVDGNHGATDILLTCLDQHGNTLWKKSYGGTREETMGGIQETNDHGFIFVGSTWSNDEDVTGNHAAEDVWVVRLDALGNILWQKCLGGSNSEQGHQVKLTPDKGFIIIGTTASNDGDVSGSHHSGQIYADSTDTWIIKLDSSGSTEWQKCLGGNNYDRGVSVIPVDGGYVTGYMEYSDDWTTYTGKANWLVKLDKQGNTVWQQSYENRSTRNVNGLIQTYDGGYMIVGSAITDTIANVERNFDAYVIKVDSIGHKEWERIYGDTNDEYFTDIQQSQDSNFIVCGVKAKGPFSAFNSPNIWVVKFSLADSILWETYFGSTDHEYSPAIVKSPDEGYLLYAVTWGNDGDVSGQHNPDIDNADLWIVKLGSASTIKGIVYYDRNQNGNKDANEPLLSGMLVRSVKDGYDRSSFSDNGLFINTVDTGSYTTTVNHSAYFTLVPASKNSVFYTYNNIDSFSFSLQPIPNKRDLVVNVIPLNIARPGFDLTYKIVYKNVGTDTIANGQILFKKDSLIDFVSAIPAQSSVTADTIKWNYSNLKPFDTASIVVNMRVQIPPAVNLNDTLSSLVIITPVAGDLTPSDDTSSVRLVVQGSYDPNDKSENLAGKITTQQVSKVSYINYLVRFQNTGTDTAFNVTIRDTLDAKLDWSSLQMTAASHPYQLNIKSQNQLTWSFSNIKLVDASRNEKASHGFIAYRVKPKSNLAIGDVIKNTATIYFDYNLPVETNTQETEVIQYSINNPQAGVPTISSFTPASGGTAASITITGTNFTGATAVSFGGVAATSFTVNSSNSITAVVGAGASGNVSVTTPGGTATLAGFTFTVVTAIDPVPANSLGIRFYPNPTTGSFVIDTLKLADKWETLEIFDTQGKKKLSNFTIRNKTRVTVSVEYLSNGLYMAILKRKNGPATVIKILKF